jgi:hypothetical protein
VGRRSIKLKRPRPVRVLSQARSEASPQTAKKDPGAIDRVVKIVMLRLLPPPANLRIAAAARPFRKKMSGPVQCPACSDWSTFIGLSGQGGLDDAQHPRHYPPARVPRSPLHRSSVFARLPAQAANLRRAVLLPPRPTARDSPPAKALCSSAWRRRRCGPSKRTSGRAAATPRCSISPASRLPSITNTSASTIASGAPHSSRLAPICPIP